MNKQDIIDHLTYRCGLRRSSAIQAVNGIIQAVTQALSSGNNVSIRGLGTLAPVKREQKTALDFKTKEPVIVPAHTSVKFKISKELKETLNNGNVD